MYTSVMLIALSGVAAPMAVAENPSWQSYSAAQKDAERQQKPLAVVLGSGRNGWEKLSQAGKLGMEAKQLLMSKYIPVYVDTTTPEGQKLATDFAMPSGKGIVISDRTGKLQAFWHEGELADTQMVSCLERYADPERSVSTTDTNSQERVSNYPPTGALQQQGLGAVPGYPGYYGAMQPTLGGIPGYYPGFGGFGGFGGGFGGGCPSCGGGRR